MANIAYISSIIKGTSDGLSVILGSALGKLFPGTVLNCTVLRLLARTSRASSIAKPVPTQFLGPAPKGTYAPFDPRPDNSLMYDLVSSSGSHLSGLKASGSCHLSLSLCRTHALTSTVVPAPKGVNLSAASAESLAQAAHALQRR